jgi:hypothetical protein
MEALRAQSLRHLNSLRQKPARPGELEQVSAMLRVTVRRGATTVTWCLAVCFLLQARR